VPISPNLDSSDLNMNLWPKFCPTPT